ncbi:DUF2169 family type VI secretion system accessory protein [Paraburkholderia megapolitana]|uniref:DUF2169 domain-containing protein n=1 Tax=Paraburkholderia megapolitana TaxID=420953 RepID=A0A1I3NYK6_9BURK|nr:DUF2169 domain-containing protein [Paraburkholderia megapolitana]QDQ84538.1 DUF2169 domain-containing protein [Paraburkholderia megapolitana]SFJ14299.1 hypothetical protein SAMN05192543_105563 [Paraburkholderia megapolitana]
MEFSNFTPFPALAFESFAPNGASFHTVVLRQTFELRNGSLVLAQKQKPLATTDRFFGEPNQSSVVEESDLAPYKPFCDVLVDATAYVPQGRPLPRFAVGVRLTSAPMITDRASATASTQVLLDRRLVVMGERYFVRRSTLVRYLNKAVAIGTFGAVRRADWKLTAPKPIAALPVRYEYAWGGQCRVNADHAAAGRVPKAVRLDDQQQAGHPDQGQIPVAHTTCEANPVGLGFACRWYVKAMKLRQVAAPQIEAAGQSITVQAWLRASEEQSPASLRPAGIGVVGKAWTTRLSLAGTYDERWLAERHPGLPDDFQFRYWNGAHADMQVPHLKGNETLVLTNLVPHGTLHSKVDERGNTTLRIPLPGHLPMGWIYTDQGLGFAPFLLDTLSVDLSETTKPEVTLVWRATLMKSVRAQRFEARFIDSDEMARLSASTPTVLDGSAGERHG